MWIWCGIVVGHRTAGFVNNPHNIMSSANFIIERIAAKGDQPALFWRGQAYDGNWLVAQVKRDVARLRDDGVGSGSLVIVKGDYSPRNVSLLLALIELNTITAPLLPSSLAKTPTLVDLVNPSFLLDGTVEGDWAIHSHQQIELHGLIRNLQ